jgi:DsbC/DsbD-like thiol-disulfide interchange protein
VNDGETGRHGPGRPGLTPAILPARIIDIVKHQEREQAIQLLATGASQKLVALRLGLAENTVMRWMKNPAFRERVEALRQEKDDPDLRSTLRDGLRATLADGITPDWKVRTGAARALASLPEEAANPDPQLFAIRIKADGTQEEVWGTVPPGFKSPAAVVMTVEDGAFPEGERDSDGWQ